MTSDKGTFRESFYALVERADSIVITAHISPDDDAIASVLSLKTILNNKYPEKNIQCIYSGEPINRYANFVGYEAIVFVADMDHALVGTDLLIVCDVGTYARIGIKDTETLSHIKNKVAIDHHASPPDAFDLSCIDSTYSSNSELIYDIFSEDLELTKSLAELFLLGILGDTGNLVHISASQSAVFIKMKRLIEVADIRVDEFLSRFRTIPKKVIPLIQELVHNTVFVDATRWPPFQYAYITRSFFDAHQYSDEEISAAAHIYLSQYLPRVEGYGWGFVVTPRGDASCRMSSRSIPKSVNVRVLHEQLAIGGGHNRAAGGFIAEDDPVHWIQQVQTWMETHEPTLD